MPTWIRPAHRIILHIAVPIQRLRVDRPTPMQFVGIRALAIQRGDEARLVKGHRQRAQRHAVHATRSVPRYHRIRANEPSNRWVVIPGIIEQQPGVVTPLPLGLEAPRLASQNALERVGAFRRRLGTNKGLKTHCVVSAMRKTLRVLGWRMSSVTPNSRREGFDNVFTP